jgi:DNA-binding NtrC family response regulator
MADTATINPTDLPHYLLLSDTKASLEGKLSPPEGDSRSSARQPLYKEMMNAFERELLQAVMNRCTTRTQAMNMLGLSRRAFYQKLQRHGFLS